MVSASRLVPAGTAFALFLCLSASSAFAQNGGLLGFYVFESPHGLVINNFIPNTSAYDLFLQNQLQIGDRMLRLNGRPLRSVRDVFAVTDQLQPGQQARLDLKTSRGVPYYIYISPSSNGGAVACAQAEGHPNAVPTSSAPYPGPPSSGPGRPSGR